MNSYSSYAKHFTEKQLIVDDNQLNIGGPLHGLLSTHIQFPQEDIFLFACDLLFMETVVFEALLLQQKIFPGKEAFVFNRLEKPSRFAVFILGKD
jgi:molybdopterin-guanine dinucleotide biosynthesis protein A